MPDAKPKRRWYRLTPDRFLIGLLVAEGLLLLADRFALFGLERGSGWNVLGAVALVGVAVLVGLLWFAVSLLFRWRFQFSIRSLLVLTIAVAIPCSWFAVKMQHARKQREAVEALRGVSERVFYAGGFDAAGKGAKPLGPAWLLDWLGVDFFLDVVAVWDGKPRFTDNYMIHLKVLTNLEGLYLGNTEVTDAGLEHIKGLTNLEGLFLDDTKVTDAGLEHLKGLTNLKFFYLTRTKVTDAGLEYLKELTNLAYLDLHYTEVTDAGLEHLKELTNLAYLDLRYTEVTDEGVKKLQQALPNYYLGHNPPPPPPG